MHEQYWSWIKLCALCLCSGGPIKGTIAEERREKEREPLKRGGRDGGKKEPLPAASQSVRPLTRLQNTLCDATHKNTAAAPSKHLQRGTAQPEVR